MKKETLVPISRDKCKEIQIDILNEVARICDAHNLSYYLAYGTLLGAVRHKGYIPWDDDIDIFMDRYSYEKLLQYIKEGHDWISVLDTDCNGYYFHCAKVIAKNTYARMGDNITEQGIWIDIFPIDGLPKGKYRRICYVQYMHFLRAIIISATTNFNAEDVEHRWTKRILYFYAKIVGMNKISNRFIKCSKRYDVSKSEYVTSFFSPYGVRDIMKACEIFQTAEYVFEKITYKGPKNYDLYLKKLYGDYMKLPPENKRKSHFVTAWGK